VRNTTQRRRGRARLRSRRVLVLVLAVDLIGGASLAYALTRSNSSKPQRTPTLGASLIAHPQDPLTQTVNTPAGLATATAPVKAPSPHPDPRRPQHAGRSLGGSRGSFAAFAAAQPGRVGLAIAPLGQGPISTYGSLQVGHAWSTMKVPVLTTLLSDLESQGRALDAHSRGDATLALEQSNNAAAEALFSELEQNHGGLDAASLAVQHTLNRAGDDDVRVNTSPNDSGFTTWGQTQWSAIGEVTFYRSLARGCLLSSADTTYVLSLMRDVESAQRWGAGAAEFGAPVAFKGGWGPEIEYGGGYLVRQTAIIGSDDHGYVLSMLAQPQDGSFTTGTMILDHSADWVAKTFDASATASPASCS
jgi:hypothetical protein